MENISTWCKAVALVSIVSSVFSLLLSGNKLKNAFKALTSLIMIYTFAVPVLSGSMDFSSLGAELTLSDFENESSEYDNYQYYPLLLLAQEEAEKLVDELIKEVDAKGECTVVCEYEDNESLCFSVTVKSALSEEEKELLKEEITEKLAGKVTVKFEGVVADE